MNIDFNSKTTYDDDDDKYIKTKIKKICIHYNYQFL